MKPILDGGLFNWAITPAIVFGRGSTSWWLYVWWLRGRLGFYKGQRA
jgi:hypothetical protein